MRQDGRDRDPEWTKGRLGGGDSIQGRERGLLQGRRCADGGKCSRNHGMLASSSELPQTQQSRQGGKSPSASKRETWPLRPPP